jgi:purine-binding chemotaxis protein CheW
MVKINEEIPEEQEDTQKGKYLTFFLDQEAYGIEIRYVTEIIGIQPITAVPEVPAYVRGIINLRGKIIPVLDVRLKFHKETVPYNDRTCIIVVEIQEMPVGLIVDHVADVSAIPETQIVPPPDVRTGFHNRYIQGVGQMGGEVKLLLDCERLLTDDEITALEAVG